MKVLVAGGGSIGARHLSNLRTLGAGALALMEPEPERRLGLCAGQDAVGFATIEEALAWGPNAVVVASPTHLHAVQALAALRHGCALFVEKPLSHSLAGLEMLCEEAERRSLVTMVACNMRFHPGPAAVKAALDANEIGSTIAARLQTGSYLPAWRPGQDYRRSYSASAEYGGAILDCIHEIDLALWYLGPARLAAAAARPARELGLETEGLAEILLRHECGALSSVHLNFVQRDYRRTCQIIGTTGTIYWDFAGRQVQLYDPEGRPGRSESEPDGWEVNQMYLDEMAHFLASAQNHEATVNPLAGGLAALRIALAARQAAGSGGENL